MYIANIKILRAQEPYMYHGTTIYMYTIYTLLVLLQIVVVHCINTVQKEQNINVKI